MRRVVIKPGADIYVPSSWYIGHGEDDFSGGLCKISRVWSDISAGKQAVFLSCEERPGHGYNARFLVDKQAALAEMFGERRGRPDPDYNEYE